MIGKKWNNAVDGCAQRLNRLVAPGWKANEAETVRVKAPPVHSSTPRATSQEPSEPPENNDDLQAFSSDNLPDWAGKVGDAAGEVLVGTAGALGLANVASNLQTAH